MSTPPRRRPHVDDNSLHVIQEAIDFLAVLRGCCCSLADPSDHLHDPGDALHLAWSLSRQIDDYLLELINDAYDHGYSWDQIRDFFDTPLP